MFSEDLLPRDVPPRPLVPDHDLLRVIGKGAYGEVWLARNIIGTFRAVKIVFRPQFEDEQPYEREFNGIKRFEPVSRAHESLVDILQIGRNDQLGYFYYVMELADNAAADHNSTTDRQLPLVPGGRSPLSGAAKSALCGSVETYRSKTLRSELNGRGRLPIGECIRIGLALSSALENLHQNGLVHRDIKPSNIIFVSGFPKLADIGLVAQMSEAKSLVGTPGYIPQEGPGTPQADIYSLGKVLYEMSTGREHADFPRLPENLRELGDADALIEFNEIVLKACQQDPRDRYKSAAKMRGDLELLAAGSSVNRSTILRERPAWPAFRKVALFVVPLVLTAAAAVLFMRGHVNYELESRDPDVINNVKWGDEIRLDSTPERLATAVEHYRSAIAKDPKFVPAHIGLFRARLLQLGGFRQPAPDAVSNLCAAAKELVNVAPNLAEAEIAAAYLEGANGHPTEALARARRATLMRPASKEGGAFVHQMYGSSLLRMGKYKESLTELSLAEKENAANPTLQLQLGNWYFAQGYFDGALEHFTRSIEVRPEQYWAYWCKGKCYEEKEAFPEAINWFELADLRSGQKESEVKASYDELRRAFKIGGRDGYWQARLERESVKPRPAAHVVAVCLAHLHRDAESYEWLEAACKGGNLDGLWFEPCWNRKDPRFQTLAKRFMSPP